MIKKPPFTISFIPQYLLLAVMRLIAYLPFRVSRKLATTIGWLAYRLGGKRVVICRKNIASCFPELDEKQVEALVKQSFVSVGHSIVELCIIWFADPHKKIKPVSINGLDHYHNAIREGKGCLLLGFHFTDLEIGGILLSRYTEQNALGAMYRDQDNPLTNYYMLRARAKALKPIARDKIRHLFKWIKEGKSIWYAADQDYGPKQSVFVPFFNEPAATITVVSNIVRATGCQVLPFTQQRLEGGGVALEIFEPLPMDGKDPEQEARNINQFLEKLIRKRPADYLWTHRRFKTRPGGAAEFYGFDKKPKHFLPARKLAGYLRKGEIIEGNETQPQLIALNDQQSTMIRVFGVSKWHIGSWLPVEVKSFMANEQSSFHWAYIREKHCYLVYFRGKN